MLFTAKSDRVIRNSPRESGFYHRYQQITRQRERDPEFLTSIAIDIGKMHRLRECESNLLKYYDMKVLIKLNAEFNLICRLLETVFIAVCELYNRNLAPTEARYDIDRRSQPMLTKFEALKRQRLKLCKLKLYLY